MTDRPASSPASDAALVDAYDEAWDAADLCAQEDGKASLAKVVAARASLLTRMAELRAERDRALSERGNRCLAHDLDEECRKRVAAEQRAEAAERDVAQISLDCEKEHLRAEAAEARLSRVAALDPISIAGSCEHLLEGACAECIARALRRALGDEP